VSLDVPDFAFLFFTVIDSCPTCVIFICDLFIALS
jgi:hypothetical protein